MTLPSRKYIGLPKAAEILNCSVEDIVHWAAIKVTKIGIPYSSDGFNPPTIIYGEDFGKKLPDYGGFAFINAGYLLDAELTGTCTFPSLDLDTGQSIGFTPQFENGDFEWERFATKGLSLARLFIRIEELHQLEDHAIQSADKPLATTERAHVSDKLAYMNQAAAKFWGNADRNDRGTHPENATVTAWLVQQGFSQTLADKAATLIRPEWAPTGRRPEE